MSQNLEPSDPLLGQLITGRYRIESRIGEGGMGTVYAARHEAIEKRIALKVLHHEYSSNPDVVDRFKREAISASRIKHPNVIDVFDFGQLDDGACFIAMEFLDGRDLGDALENVGAFDPQEALRITVQVCRALGTAHARGVVHRDMKPENIFLQRTPEGEQVVKIVDFGIAQLRQDDAEQGPAATRQRRLTKTGMIFGTPEYMAPEQARGKNVDHRADIYATGVILYELLCGGVPFAGDSFLDVLNKHCLEAVPSMRKLNPVVRISAELEAVVHKSLEKLPDDRYESMKDFLHALLRTPEGRAVRNSTSGLGDLDAEPPAAPTAHGGAAVSSAIPPTVRADGPLLGVSVAGSDSSPTAMMGSHHEVTTGVHAHLEDDEPVLPTRSRGGLWLGSLAVLVLGAGVAFYLSPETLGLAPKSDSQELLGREPEGSAPEAPDPAPADPEPAGPAPAGDPVAGQGEEGRPTGEGAGTDEPPLENEAPDRVVLHVLTQPEGAIVEKGGFQVCDASPCDVSVAPDEAVVLVARKDGLRGTARVLAQKSQDVTITLRRPAPRPPAPAPASEPAMCEVVVDGLKILRPCQ